MEKVAGKDDPDAEQQMRSFIDNFSPLLADVHTFLVGGNQALPCHEMVLSAACVGA